MADSAKTVAVLGGGIAGLSTAHHLTNRGYRVTVFEARGDTASDLGGKARSYRVDREGMKVPPGDADGQMFGEHGFRFFPGFYSHVTETMSEIKLPEAGTVASRLRPLEETAFYVRKPGQPRGDRGGGKNLERYARVDAFLFKFGSLLFLAWLGWGGLLFYGAAAIWWWGIWIAAPFAWLLVRTILVGLTASGTTELSLPLPVGRRAGRKDSRLQSWLLRIHPWARFVGVIAVFASLAFVDRPLRLLPLVLVIAAIVCWYPALATMNYLWGVVGRIPIAVRPGVLESVVAFLRVTVVVTSSQRRLYSQWEQNSWWSFIEAYRYSRYFRLAFATGLTRAFVATRAEEMSARTGATILTQLLFDASPTLRSRQNDADRVLSAPTQEAWINPWVDQLTRNGVRFNEFLKPDGEISWHSSVEVTSLRADEAGGCIADFEFVDRSGGEGNPPRVECAPQRFDHYVLAVSGTAAQRILANSPTVIHADRKATSRPSDPLGSMEQGKDRSVPYLAGIFNLKFGWMTGIVYHLEDEVVLPRGHLLCLESEWALTALEQGRTWDAGVDRWRAVVSVNVSDWFSPSNDALPACFETIETVAKETWHQLRTHVPALEHIHDTPPFVPDTAIEDPDPVAQVTDLPILLGPTTSTAALENLPLVNDEKLLVNVAGSWDDRPTAKTVFRNLVIAGDYVRTWTDFASMESADEAARRAVNVILERDERGGELCSVRQLPLPPEFRFPVRLLRWVDGIATWARLPHPLMLLATPIGWGAGIEVSLRRLVIRARGIKEASG